MGVSPAEYRGETPRQASGDSRLQVKGLLSLYSPKQAVSGAGRAMSMVECGVSFPGVSVVPRGRQDYCLVLVLGYISLLGWPLGPWGLPSFLNDGLRLGSTFWEE